MRASASAIAIAIDGTQEDETLFLRCCASHSASLPSKRSGCRPSTSLSLSRSIAISLTSYLTILFPRSSSIAYPFFLTPSVFHSPSIPSVLCPSSLSISAWNKLTNSTPIPLCTPPSIECRGTPREAFPRATADAYALIGTVEGLELRRCDGGWYLGMRVLCAVVGARLGGVEGEYIGTSDSLQCADKTCRTS
jgi:hypothetical protein